MRQYRVQLIVILLTGVLSFFGYEQYSTYLQTAETRALLEQALTQLDSQVAAPTTISPTLVTTQSAQLVGGEIATVASVQDGDTITLVDGRKVRYIGIDAPERKGTDTAITCFNHEAYQANVALVLGKTIELQKDKRNTDKYGRLLRYVYADGKLVNAILIAQGYARSKWYAPDTQKQIEFDALEHQARQEKKGLWGVCSN